MSTELARVVRRKEVMEHVQLLSIGLFDREKVDKWKCCEKESDAQLLSIIELKNHV